MIREYVSFRFFRFDTIVRNEMLKFYPKSFVKMIKKRKKERKQVIQYNFVEPLESAIDEHRNRNFPRWEKKRKEKRRKERKKKKGGEGRDNLERGILIKIHGYQPRVAEQKTKEPRKNIEKIPRMTNETALPFSLLPFNPPSFCRSSRVLFIHVTVHEDRRIPEYTLFLALG